MHAGLRVIVPPILLLLLLGTAISKMGITSQPHLRKVEVASKLQDLASHDTTSHHDDTPDSTHAKPPTKTETTVSHPTTSSSYWPAPLQYIPESIPTPAYFSQLPDVANVGKRGVVSPELPLCHNPLDVGLGKWIPFPKSPVAYLTHWYQPPNCSLRVFNRKAATKCLHNKKILYSGPSTSRNQWTALTGFLMDNHWWDFKTKHAPANCSTSAEARYVLNKKCHMFISGSKFEGERYCNFMRDIQRPSFKAKDTKCHNTSDHTSLGPEGHLGWAPHVEAPLRTGLFPTNDVDYLIMGFHFGWIYAYSPEKVWELITEQLEEVLVLLDKKKAKPTEGGKRPHKTIQMILHSMHARDLTYVPPKYHVQGNIQMHERAVWMDQYAHDVNKQGSLSIHNVAYWGQYYMSDPRTGYVTPQGGDGTHVPLYIELMKAQILLNYLCRE
eukprot:TRINITY_DN68171_c8_g3_i1.p1 TRINITY_DN68171_c8_g3~~TRINITY_DN68171_c8_g3_i1.p1  ORF type:complete len:441 (+),score=23.20 TRINITY_DN68171_c8_g3_i1:99-1421(+)